MSRNHNQMLEQIYMSDPEPDGFDSAYDQLRPQEKLFVNDYIENLANSALRAGKAMAEYVAKGGRPRSSGATAKDLLSRPLIRAAIAQRVREITAAYEISTGRALQEIKMLAYSNIRDFFDIDANGSPSINFTRATREQWAAVKSIKIGQSPFGPTLAFEMHSKQPALDVLVRLLGVDKTGVSDPKIIDVNPNVIDNAQLYASTLED